MADPEEAIPSISTGAVGSRFVTEKDIVEAREKRDEAWAAAYARIGQAPPPRPVEDAWDGRSLAEKLAANKAAKQEEWEERNKLSNQFRALEADEIQFLNKMKREADDKEKKRKQEEDRDLNAYRSAVTAARGTVKEEERPKEAAPKPPPLKLIPKKKPALKGVQVKRKPPKDDATSGEPGSPETKRQKLNSPT